MTEDTEYTLTAAVTFTLPEPDAFVFDAPAAEPLALTDDAPAVDVLPVDALVEVLPDAPAALVGVSYWTDSGDYDWQTWASDHGLDPVAMQTAMLDANIGLM